MKHTEWAQHIIAQLKVLGLEVQVDHATGKIQIGEVVFEPPSSTQSFDTLSEKNGLFLNDSTNELRQSLDSKKINFLDKHGNASIHFGEFNFRIQHVKTKDKKIKKSSQLNTNISSTLLVSPNGFAIVDALFRFTNNELTKFPSALSFCKKLSLNQPKLSKIMTALNAKSLFDLKTKIQKIPIDWWLYSFDQAITKRKMQPFYETEQSYYTKDTSLESLSNEKLLVKINNNFNGHFSEGPTTVAQSFSEIVEGGISLWLSPTESNNFKKYFKLIPGKKENCKNWQIAIAPNGLNKMELKTHFQNFESNMPKANILRSVWDLSFSEARAREVRANILRKFLK